MAILVYTVNTSIDGYVNDANGSIDFTPPSEEVLAFITDHERSIGTYLYGRRLYETMAVWEDMPLDGASPAFRDFADVWRAADKIVFSTTLDAVPTSHTRVERAFEPDAIVALKAAATKPVSVGGATLAGEAVRLGLVDEVHQFINAVSVGGGTPWLPHDVRLNLELLDERRFGSGVLNVHYRILGPCT